MSTHTLRDTDTGEPIIVASTHDNSIMFLVKPNGEYVLVVIYSHRTRTYHYFDMDKARRESLVSDIKRKLGNCEVRACVVVIEGEYFCMPCDSWRQLINALNDDEE